MQHLKELTQSRHVGALVRTLSLSRASLTGRLARAIAGDGAAAPAAAFDAWEEAIVGAGDVQSAKRWLYVLCEVL